MSFNGTFINDKTSKSKFVWYIVPSDPEEEEYDPIAGFAETLEEAETEANAYIDAYTAAKIIITNMKGVRIQ